MKPTLQQFGIIAVVLLASGLVVRAWKSGSSNQSIDSIDEQSAIVTQQVSQLSDRPDNSASTAALIPNRISTAAMVRPVALVGDPIEWDSQIIVDSEPNDPELPPNRRASKALPKIVNPYPLPLSSTARRMTQIGSPATSPFATPAESQLKFPRVVRSSDEAHTTSAEDSMTTPRTNQRVIANQYAISAGASEFRSGLAGNESYSPPPPPPIEADETRPFGPVVIQNSMNQVVENGSSDVVKNLRYSPNQFLESSNEFPASEIAESQEQAQLTDNLDERATSDDFVKPDRFLAAFEFESDLEYGQSESRPPVASDVKQKNRSVVLAQTKTEPNTNFPDNQFVPPQQSQATPPTVGGVPGTPSKQLVQEAVVDPNVLEKTYPANRVASGASLTVTNPTAKAPKKMEAPKTGQLTLGALVGADSFVLAAEPPANAHWQNVRPQVDPRAVLIETVTEDFSPDAVDERLPYDPFNQMHVYEGKTLYANQRPLVELGRPWYQLGQLSPGSTILGKHNNLVPQFLVYGDFRTAVASNSQNGDGVTQTAYELNLDFDLRLTSTGRFHMFMSPLDNGVVNTGYVFDDDEWVDQYDANIDFGYFEGDLGAMVGGFINKTLPFDLPYTLGVIPLLFQNGIWMEDAILGVAATIPARNSARFDISNMDITFFAGFDKINSPAFLGDDSASRMYGMASFIEALNGYIELDYAYLEDRTIDDRSYHNIGFGYSRRYGRLLSNSTRIIVNAGQSTDVVENTADGTLLLSENTLITGAPLNVLPYFNFFAGFDRPQSAARAAQAGGILRNTGILFESDGMTNYPTLDPTANNTVGGALGLNLLANDFTQQLVVEMAFLNVFGNNATRIAPGDQYGIGMRYQLPLSNSVIFRTDAMYGFFEDADDVHGVRMELRKKW